MPKLMDCSSEYNIIRTRIHTLLTLELGELLAIFAYNAIVM